MTARRERRTNNEGHPCPPWCVTDHQKVHGAAGTYQFHGGTRVGIRIPGAYPGSSDPISASPVHDGTESGRAHVALSGYRPGAGPAGASYVRISASDAGDLAVLIGMLAEATPDQHRQLAEAIRKAASEIAGAGER
jgi:hypothetical protein